MSLSLNFQAFLLLLLCPLTKLVFAQKLQTEIYDLWGRAQLRTISNIRDEELLYSEWAL